MNYSDRDLSRELFELSGWEPEGTKWWYVHNDLAHEVESKPEGDQWENNRYWPLYQVGLPGAEAAN